MNTITAENNLPYVAIGRISQNEPEKVKPSQPVTQAQKTAPEKVQLVDASAKVSDAWNKTVSYMTESTTNATNYVKSHATLADAGIGVSILLAVVLLLYRVGIIG